MCGNFLPHCRVVQGVRTTRRHNVRKGFFFTTRRVAQWKLLEALSCATTTKFCFCAAAALPLLCFSCCAASAVLSYCV